MDAALDFSRKRQSPLPSSTPDLAAGALDFTASLLSAPRAFQPAFAFPDPAIAALLLQNLKYPLGGAFLPTANASAFSPPLSVSVDNPPLKKPKLELVSLESHSPHSSTSPSSASSQSSPPQRKQAAPIPDEKKIQAVRSTETERGLGYDAAYYERRRKNNDAAKRSRDARRHKEEQTALKANQLEQENIQLKAEISSMRLQIQHYQLLLSHQISASSASPPVKEEN
ncbi:hypothetical protein QR680_009765 [Steinernema hermaphroditum]|uniref:BZIP domain-containing protein n=1 Tax=Steinernema hermaphroditum TaxID=289476 RepID=A0AA39MAI2_9BILA|nr:hypothetical protein QR680_009765 [Steinernema hermaphroditum]